MSYAPPERAPRTGSIPDRLITFRIPTVREDIIASLQMEQSAYEIAKRNLTKIEEERQSEIEQIEDAKSRIAGAVDADAHASMAARNRALETALASDPSIFAHEQHLREINRALGPAKEDVSVFRHRMLTLRAALAPDPEAALALNDETGDR